MMNMNKHILRFGKNKIQVPIPVTETNTIKSHKKCTMYLIDTSIFENDGETKINGSYLTNLISDQYKDLWKVMKRGDFVYDISNLSGDLSEDLSEELSEDLSEELSEDLSEDPSEPWDTKFPYIVDIEADQPEHIRMIRNGLVIRDPDTSWDPMGSVLPNMFTITEFPIRYFDKPITDTSMCSHFKIMIKINTPCSVWLDVAKLKLNTLTYDNVFHVKTIEYPLKHIQYLYTVLTYKKKNYMIIHRDTENNHNVADNDLIDRFINFFKDPVLTETSNKINHKIKEFAKNENVLDENILLIKIF